MVDDLVHHQRDEVRDLELDHGPAADEGGAHACTRLRGFRDRRVDHALRSEALEQARRDLEQAAHLRDVLADDEDALVAAHLLVQGLVQRLRHRQLTRVAHDSLPGASQSAGA